MTATRSAWITTVVACIVALGVLQSAPAAPAESDATVAAQGLFWRDAKEYDFSFAGVFPRPVYQKSYFTWLMIGASVVVAGALCYFTAGAGAPAAASGVSTVASTIAGGGAGSYMAGLSIVGGWFGGNAMLGSAILNGIALGLGGGGTAYVGMTTIGKVGVMASVTATALDGVLVFAPDPDKKELVYRVRLAVPDGIGSDEVTELVETLNDTEADLVKIANKIEEARSSKDDKIIQKLQTESSDLLKKRDDASEEAERRAKDALKQNLSSADLLVLAILSKNAGRHKTYAQLLRRIRPETLTNRSYLDYLNAVTLIEQGDLAGSRELLKRAWGASPYAVEPALLLINVVGHKGILKSEKDILEVVKRAEEKFDSDDYASSYSLLALYYRVGSMYFLAKRYPDAQKYYEKAYAELPWTQKYIGSPQLRNLIQLGIANSLYGQGKPKKANKLFETLIEEADTEDERALLRSQYVPNVKK